MITRREFAKWSAAAAGGLAFNACFPHAIAQVQPAAAPLLEFGYGDVTMTSALCEGQLRETSRFGIRVRRLSGIPRGNCYIARES